MGINIDWQIDNNKCPAGMCCTVATTGYDQQKRENICYRCWKNYCQDNDIEIIYEQE